MLAYDNQRIIAGNMQPAAARYPSPACIEQSLESKGNDSGPPGLLLGHGVDGSASAALVNEIAHPHPLVPRAVLFDLV